MKSYINFSQEKNILSSDEIMNMVENYINSFISNNTVICENARHGGWLGYLIKKSNVGLLGYMRTSYALQIKILENLSTPLPIYQKEFYDFFTSSYFRNEVKKNGRIKDFYKNDHFEIIKKYKL